MLLGALHANQQVEVQVAIDVGPGNVLMESGIVQFSSLVNRSDRASVWFFAIRGLAPNGCLVHFEQRSGLGAEFG